MPQVICEKVTVTGNDTDNNWLVQYEDTPKDRLAKDSCLRYLADCEYAVTCEPHPVVGIGDDPAMSWGDLSDVVAPRDD